MFKKIICGLAFLSAALVFCNCGNDDSTSANNTEQESQNLGNGQQKTYMVIDKCQESTLGKRTVFAQADSLVDLTYTHPQNPYVYSCGDCGGGFTLTMLVSDFCSFDADIKITQSNDTLVISYDNMTNVSKCTCTSNHKIYLAPYGGYVRLNGITHAISDCPYQIVCQNYTKQDF